MLAHVGLAVTEARSPLGVFEINATQRDGTLAAETPDNVPESVRWLRGLERAGQIPESRVITVCDREGDIWDLLQTARQTGNGLVVRSDRGRQRRVAVDGDPRELWDFMDAQPVLGTKTITISPCGGPRKRRERKARLELRAAMVDLVPPSNRAGDEAPLAMLAVSVLEPEPPKGKMPLHRVLLTTEGEAEIDNARYGGQAFWASLACPAGQRRVGRVAERVQVYHRLQGQGNPGRTGPVRIACPYLRPEVVMGLAHGHRRCQPATAHYPDPGKAPQRADRAQGRFAWLTG